MLISGKKEEVIETINNYHMLLDIVDEIVDFSPNYIIVEDGKIRVEGESMYCGCSYDETDIIPVDWLFMDDEELEEAKRLRRIEEEEKRKAAEKAAEEQLKIKREKEERELYEKLKAKYEGE